MIDTSDSSSMEGFSGSSPIAPAFGIAVEDDITEKNTDSTAAATEPNAK